MKKLLITFLVCILNITVNISYLKAESNYEKLLKNGIELFNEKKIQEAKEIFDSLITKKPSRPEAYSTMALIHISTGAYKAASGKLKKAISRDKNYPYSYYLLGRVLEEMKDYSGAMFNYKKFLNMNALDESSTELIEKVKKKIDYLNLKINKKNEN